MRDLFLKVLEASLDGSIVIAVVLLLRLVLKKAPKKYVCLLWILAGLRLLVPFHVESQLSLQPKEQPVAQEAWQQLEDYGQILSESDPVDVGQAPPEQNSIADPAEPQDVSGEDVEVTVSYEINWAVLAPYIWLAVACGLGLYSLLSYLRLKRRVREAVKLPEGAWECAGLDTAFILGFFRPRIYIPTGLSSENQQFILDHERTHLKRGDHWVKLLGFIALAVHWFNPLVWVAYVLLCRDIEMACDEQVVKNLDLSARKAYSAALLSCSSGRAHYAACPVAFGEVSVKSRIKSVLNYRRPRFWISLIAIAAILFVAVCFLTDPAAEEPDLSFLNYKNAVSLAAEQDVFVAVHYTPEDEGDYIGIGMVEGKTLAEYLDSADWSKTWFEPSSLSSPGSVAFNLAEDYRITVYDRRIATVEYGEEVRYYRTGKDAYEKAVAILLPADHERLGIETADQEDPNAPDWGITVSVFNVTSKGLTFRIDQSGEVVFPEGLSYGQDFSLEVWNGTAWEAVEPIIENWGFTTEAILLSKGQKTDVRIDWAWLYGALPAGEYRIGKTIRQEKVGGGGDYYTYYVSFQIPDAAGKDTTTEQNMLPQGRELTAEELDTFRELFTQVIDGRCNWFNMALTSEYETPADLNLYQFFYNACWEDLEVSQAEMDYVTAQGFYNDTPLLKYPVSRMNEILEQYFGLSLDETNGIGLEQFVYNSDTNSYYDFHGDWSDACLTIFKGIEKDDGTIVIYYTDTNQSYTTVGKEVTLKPTGNGSYQILSNVQAGLQIES